MKQAVIFGSTGLVGEQLLLQVLRDNYYEAVINFVRKPTAIEHAKLRTIITDFSGFDQYGNAFSGADVYCCLGTTIATVNYDKEAFKQADLYRPLQIAEAAKKFTSAQYLVVSALGANKKSSFFYNRVKGELEASLKQLNLPAVHIMHPSFIVGKRKEKRKGERLATFLTTLFRPFMFGPLKKARPILAADVAAAMINIAKTHQPGFHIYPSDQLQELSHAK